MHKTGLARLFASAAALSLVLSAPAAAHQAAAPAAAAGITEADLAKPPADAQAWIITSTGGTHGKLSRWTAADGTRWARESLLLRGFKTEIDEATRFAPDGSVASFAIRGSTPSGDAAERFTLENGRYSYQSPVDQGEAAATGKLFYLPYGGLAQPGFLLAEALIKAPGRAVDLAPSGRATLNPLTTLQVTHNGQGKTLTAYTLDGLSLTPQPVWFDGERVFGSAGFLNFLPAGWEAVAPQLSKAQDEALARRAPALLAKLAPKAAQPILFSDVKLYDADARAFRDGMSVVVEGGKIVQVAPAAQLRSVANARVIDGRGKTLVPGLWDSHMHYGDDGTGPLLLGTGITNVRDPGNKPDDSIARKARVDRGELLGPAIIPVMLIDGEGPLAAQMAVTATSEATAIAAVRKAKNMGFAGVKLYGSLDPKLVPVIAKEAKALGLRVQGHVPRTMRPLDAVRAGYDELTHINFVMMQAMPQAVVDASNSLQRFYGPGRYAGEVDLDSPEFKAFVAELKQRGTVVDPTLAIFEGGFLPERAETAPMYLPYEGTLPPALGRALKGGSFAATPEVSREQMRRSFVKLQQLVVALHRAGVPIVAGTDGAGIELIRDLELYVDGGLSPAEALATATIIPAQAFGVAGRTGSITVGKDADLALVAGDPSKDIGDLRKTEWVMRDGRLMNAAELRAAAGLSGAPR